MLTNSCRWVPFDAARNFPDLGPKFRDGEFKARAKLRAEAAAETAQLARQGTTHKVLKDSGKDDKRKKAPVSKEQKMRPPTAAELHDMDEEDADVLNDSRDLAWSAVLKRTFEAYIRGERPNMYGEWLKW